MKIDKQTGRQRQTDKQRDRLTDKQAIGKIDRYEDRQTEKQIATQKNR